MSDSIGKLSVVISADNSELRKGFNDSTKLVKSFDVSISRMGSVRPQKLNDNIKGVSMDLKSLRKEMTSTGAHLGKALAAGIASGGTFAAGMIGKDIFGNFAGNLGELARDSINIRSEIEQNAASFEVLTGSVKDASDMMAQLRKLAAESPLTSRNSSQFAKSLLGAGIAKDDVVPVLKMLTDIGQGKSEEIGRIVYAYGQIKGAGQLYMQDLHQILNANVPIMPELSKEVAQRTGRDVNVGNIKDYIEAGKVGFADLHNAMKRLTDEGGRFHGMSDKFSQTFGGQLEQLKDAGDITMAEFGKALIEELRLVDGMKDLGKYTERVKKFIEEIRPAIRSVGDVVRGIIQVGSELIKADYIFVNTLWTELAAASPQIGRLSNQIRELIEDAKNFKIDPVKVVNFAFDVAEIIDDAIGEMIDGLEVFFDVLTDLFKMLREITINVKAAAASVRIAREVVNPRNMIAGQNSIHTKQTREDFQTIGKAVASASGVTLPDDRKTMRDRRREWAVDRVTQKVNEENWDAFNEGMGDAGNKLFGLAESAAEATKRIGAEDLMRKQAFNIKEKYMPESDKIRREIEDLTKLLEGGFLSEREFSAAAADLMKNASKDMGQVHLANGIEDGSKELADALAKATAGNPTRTMESLLKELVDLEKARDAKNQELAPAPAVKTVKLPG